jgi:uncharacterized membrane-anchored protein
MTLLQQTISMSKDSMYVAAITSLVAVIVWLALYIRKMHQKTIEYLNDDKEKMIEVISKNTASAESQARSTERLSESIQELHKTILISNRRNP